MTRFIRCDRCGHEYSQLLVDPTIPVPPSTAVKRVTISPSEIYELCLTCVAALKKFIKEGVTS